MKTPLTKERLQSHFQYDWWKYLLSVLLCFLGWNLLFAVTAPQVPEEKKLDLMAYAVGDQEAAGAWLEELREAVRTSDDRAALKLLGELVPHFQNKQLEQ